jgi:hypothetical protein
MKTLAGIGIVVAGMVSTAAADEQTAVVQGRQIISKYGEAVVWINAATKVDLGERGVREEKAECLGVVIDPCGLTVLPLNVLDQSVLIAAAMRSKGIEGKPTVTLSDVRITLADGAEVPAQIVLKDPDLDLAFVMPDPNKPRDRRAFSFVKMGGAKTVDVLDGLIIMGRSDPQFTREPMVTLDRVACVLKKPRTLYYARAAVPGSVVFAEDGTLVGLCVTRPVGPDALKVVVLPAEAIAKVAAQVPPDKTQVTPPPRP